MRKGYAYTDRKLPRVSYVVSGGIQNIESINNRTGHDEYIEIDFGQENASNKKN